MTLELDLSPDATAILERAAASRNLTLNLFVQEIAEREAARLATNGANSNGHSEYSAPKESREERIARQLAALDELGAYARSLPDRRGEAGLPPLSDDAVAQTYREREDAQL